MEEELAKARTRAKAYHDMDGINLGIGKDTEVFLPKFEDSEVALPKVPKGLAFEKTKSRQSEVKFQSAIYSSWNNAYD